MVKKIYEISDLESEEEYCELFLYKLVHFQFMLKCIMVVFVTFTVELVIYLCYSESDWWRVRHLTTLAEGLIPWNFVAEEKSVESEE